MSQTALIQHLNLEDVTLVAVYIPKELVKTMLMSTQVVSANMIAPILKDVCQIMAIIAVNACLRQEHLGVPDIVSNLKKTIPS